MDAEDDPGLETTCPSCGGAGGGPFGRAGGAWDREDFVCPRCKGRGVILVTPGLAKPRTPSQPPEVAETPRVAKAGPPSSRGNRRASGDS